MKFNIWFSNINCFVYILLMEDFRFCKYTRKVLRESWFLFYVICDGEFFSIINFLQISNWRLQYSFVFNVGPKLFWVTFCGLSNFILFRFLFLSGYSANIIANFLYLIKYCKYLVSIYRFHSLCLYLIFSHTSIPIFMYGLDCWAISKTDARKIDALDQWCLRMLLGIKWYQFVRNDDVRRLTKQPKLTAIIHSRRLTLFGHIMRMDDNADAKRILLASPLADWRRQLGRPASRGSAPSNRIWNYTTLRSLKQQIRLRTALCGGWCRRMALRNRELHDRNDDDDP